MAEFTGKNLYISFAGTQVNCFYRTMSLSKEIGLVDSTTACDDSRTYLTTLKDGTATLTFLAQTDDVGATDIPQLMSVGDEGSLIIGPEGSTAGERKITVNAIVQSFDEDYTYDDIVTYTIGVQFSGDVTENTF